MFTFPPKVNGELTKAQFIKKCSSYTRLEAFLTYISLQVGMATHLIPLVLGVVLGTLLAIIGAETYRRSSSPLISGFGVAGMAIGSGLALSYLPIQGALVIMSLCFTLITLAHITKAYHATFGGTQYMIMGTLTYAVMLLGVALTFHIRLNLFNEIVGLFVGAVYIIITSFYWQIKLARGFYTEDCAVDSSGGSLAIIVKLIFYYTKKLLVGGEPINPLDKE